MPATRPGDARTVVVWRGLDALLGAAPLDVVDAGGGTGAFAVPLAADGHRVTVVEPSPDALATLERRAAQAGVGDLLRGLQGDLDALSGLVPDGADVVLCHNVLEHVDDPAAGVAQLAAVLRPGGLLSVLVPGRGGAAFGHAVAGRYADALAVLTGRDSSPRRFTADDVRALCAGAGLQVETVRGVRVFAEAPGDDPDPEAAQALADLELAAADDPAFLGVAGQLHVLARK